MVAAARRAPRRAGRRGRRRWARRSVPVRAGVGYNYDQWLRLYGVRRRRAGVGPRTTRRSPLLDGEHAGAALVAASRRASGSRGTPRPTGSCCSTSSSRTPTRVVVVRPATTGARLVHRRCRPSSAAGDPVATTFLGRRRRAGRAAATSGQDPADPAVRARTATPRLATQTSTGVGRADYLGPLGRRPRARRRHRGVPAAERCAGLNGRTGRHRGRRERRQRRPGPGRRGPDALAHVVGVADGTRSSLVDGRRTGCRCSSLSATGRRALADDPRRTGAAKRPCARGRR